MASGSVMATAFAFVILILAGCAFILWHYLGLNKIYYGITKKQDIILIKHELLKSKEPKNKTEAQVKNPDWILNEDYGINIDNVLKSKILMGRPMPLINLTIEKIYIDDQIKKMLPETTHSIKSKIPYKQIEINLLSRGFTKPLIKRAILLTKKELSKKNVKKTR